MPKTCPFHGHVGVERVPDPFKSYAVSSKYKWLKQVDSYALKMNLYFWQNKRIKLHIWSHQQGNLTGLSTHNLTLTFHIAWPRHFPLVDDDAVTVSNRILTGSGVAGKYKHLHKLTSDWFVQFQSEVHFQWCHAIRIDFKVEFTNTIWVLPWIL